MFRRYLFFIIPTNLSNSEAWSNGSPPDMVMSKLLFAHSNSATSLTGLSHPPRGSHVCGLWQPGHRCVHPCTYNVFRNPSPSAAVLYTILLIRMLYVFRS